MKEGIDMFDDEEEPMLSDRVVDGIIVFIVLLMGLCAYCVVNVVV
jgi:hypothetical protein